MPIAIFEEIARKLGGPVVVGAPIHSQADLALATAIDCPCPLSKGLPRLA